jgi:hypothetical protein
MTPLSKRCVAALPALCFAAAVGFAFLEDDKLIYSDAAEGRADMSLRVSDFPRTYIRRIKIDLTSPGHWVYLVWDGKHAREQDRGPFHSTPGAGVDGCDCNDPETSRREGSGCTPKGVRVVEGFSDRLINYKGCTYATWIDVSRRVAIHYGDYRPFYPASKGCVRVSEGLAHLIHNNAVAGVTEVEVFGDWVRSERSPSITFDID